MEDKEFKTGGYCPACLHAISGCTCWENMGEKKVFKIKVDNIPEDEIDDYLRKVAENFKKLPKGELPNVELPAADIDFPSDIDYFTKKLDDLLEHLNEKIKCGEEEDTIQNTLRNALRTRKQLKMMEDAQIIYRLSKEKEK